MKYIYFILLIILNTSVIAQPICQWAYIPVGPAQSYNTIYNVTTDHRGNIIEVGKLLGIADMDPGTGMADTSFSSMTYNYYISKTTNSGQLLWVQYFQNNSQIAFFEFMGLKINSANEIIVVGNFFGMVDFDLSASGVDTLRSHFPTYPDYFVAKYDSAGNHQWAFNIGDPSTSNIEVQSVTIMQNDNIVVAANPNGTVDVDPDTSVVHNSIGGNANLICYDTNGNYLWNNNIVPVYSYSVNNNSIDGDAAGNSYLASVVYYELTMNKFDNSGLNVWNKTIGEFSAGARVDPQSLLVDKATSEFYVAGTFGGTVDFDPGVLVVNKISSSGFFQDGFIAKYDQDMNLIWVNTYVGNTLFGNYSLDFDSANIVAVGQYKGTIDFGGGYIFSSPSTFSPFYIKINSSGSTLEGYSLSGPGSYNTINVVSNQIFVTCGNITSNTDMDPTPATLMLSTTTSNFFTAVYNVPVTSALNDFPGSSDVVSVFPNPALDILNLKFSANYIGKEYFIVDILGNKVQQGIIVGERTIIDLKSLSFGIYFIRLNDDPNTGIKFIKGVN